jgi:peptide/nickel transport system substrate-binding protein
VNKGTRSSVLLVLLIFVVAVAVGAVGCGSSTTTATTGAGTTASTGAVTTATSGTTATTAAAASTKAVVVQGVDPTSMDPAQQRETSTANVLRHLYDPLIERDSADPTKFNGVLASSWTQIDPTTVEFKLKSGIKFSGGEPFDAECVKYNVERLLGKLPNSKPAIAAVQFKPLDSAVVVDAQTVRIITKAPDPLILSRMTQLMMIPKGAVDADSQALMSVPNGTGPYTLVKWDRNNQVVLQAKPDYFMGKAKIDQVIFRTISEASTRLAELQAGNVDVITNVPPDNAADVTSQNKATVKPVEGARVAAVWFNTLKYPILAKKEVRQALNYAIDRDTITQKVMSGYGIPVATITPPYFVGYNPEMKPYAYDPEKAKSLLAAAGVPADFTLEMLLPTGRYLLAEDVTQEIASELAKVGVTVKLNAVEFGVFAKQTQARDIPELMYAAWGSPLFDPTDMLQTCVLSGTDGFSFYTNTAVDAGINKAASTVGAEHVQAVQDVEKLVYEDPPFIFLFAQKDLYGVSNRIDWSPRGDELINMYFASVK